MAERHQLYVEFEKAVTDDKQADQAGVWACRLIARGEFNHIAEIFKKSKYYKSQDYLVNGFMNGISEFGKSIQKLMYYNDYTNELFSKDLYDLQKLLVSTEKTLGYLGGTKETSLHRSLRSII